MAIRSFEIDYKGKKETIEYEDDIPFGDMESILTKTVDLSDVTKPNIKVPEYRMNLLLKTLRKAPFVIDRLTITAMGHNTVAKVIEGVMASYPLMTCLGDWMTSLLGSPTEKSSPTEPTPSAQDSSVGTQNKPNDAPPST